MTAYSIDSVFPHEARYKQTGGLTVGIAKGIRVEDTINGIIVISLDGRSQMDNKEKCFKVLEAYNDKRNNE